jgi:hypothetical protein
LPPNWAPLPQDAKTVTRPRTNQKAQAEGAAFETMVFSSKKTLRTFFGHRNGAQQGHLVLREVDLAA